MKIDKKTDSQMVLKESKIIIFIFGAIIVLVGIIAILNPSFSNPPMPWWMGALFLVLGLMIIVSTKMVTITIDKGSNKISIQKQGLLGMSVEGFDINKVKELALRQSIRSTTSKGRTLQRLVTSLFLVLSDGNEREISSSGASGTSMLNPILSPKMTNEEKIGREISSFLNVPFQLHRLPTVGEILTTVKDTLTGGPKI